MNGTESRITDPAWMEPMLPEESNRQLEDVAFDLTSKASSLAGKVNPIVALAIGNLVRSMNSAVLKDERLRGERFASQFRRAVGITDTY